MKLNLDTVVDRETVAGFYTSFKQQMEDTMKEQLKVMNGDKNTNNKDLVKNHSHGFNELVRKEKDMHKKVNSLELSLDKAEKQRQEAEEQTQKAIKQREEATELKNEAIVQRHEALEQKEESDQAFDKLSDLFDELYATKAKFVQERKQKTQQRDLSEASHNGNPDKQINMSHAQDLSTNPVKVTMQEKQKPKTENDITIVDI